MNSYQEQKLNELIRDAISIRESGTVEPNPENIKKLNDFYITVGKEQMERNLKTYLKTHNQEAYYSQCLKWIDNFRNREIAD